MIKPDVKQLNAIVRLSNEEDFNVFMGWVLQSCSIESRQSISMKGTQAKWMQGRAQQLEYLIEAVAKARETLALVEAAGKGV